MMEKKDIINCSLTIIVIFIVILTITNFSRELREQKCYDKALNLWQSVNKDYPNIMTSQESYDKNNRQACASFYYIACINRNELDCADTLEEKK